MKPFFFVFRLSALAAVGCLSPLCGQSAPVVAQLRVDFPTGSLKDIIGKNEGFGASLGYVAFDKQESSTRADGLIRLDYDQFSGDTQSKVNSYALAFQVNLYPSKVSNFFLILAPMIQLHRVSIPTQHASSYSSFATQAGVGFAFENSYLYSIEASYERMTRVEGLDFSKARFDFCFRF
jgi:hypothetical protein